MQCKPNQKTPLKSAPSPKRFYLYPVLRCGFEILNGVMDWVGRGVRYRVCLDGYMDPYEKINQDFQEPITHKAIHQTNG
jgi:hypothetical protein